jgi:hypothetical protein
MRFAKLRRYLGSGVPHLTRGDEVRFDDGVWPVVCWEEGERVRTDIAPEFVLRGV